MIGPSSSTGGHVMRGGPDQLDAALVRLVIGLGALEARQERVMDVDRPARELRAQRLRKHLHVARQHDQLDVLLLDDFEQPPLLLLLGLGRHRQVVEGNVVARGELVEGAVVRDDGRDLDGQRADRDAGRANR